MNPRPTDYESNLIKIDNDFNLRELFEQERSKFVEWLKNERKVTDKLPWNYISAVDRLLPEGVRTPKELDRTINGKPKHYVIGIRQFFNYLEDEYEISELNGYPLSRWKFKLKSPRSKPREVYVTDEEIRQAYERIEDDRVRVIFKLILYSGIRLTHAVEML